MSHFRILPVLVGVFLTQLGFSQTRHFPSMEYPDKLTPKKRTQIDPPVGVKI